MNLPLILLRFNGDFYCLMSIYVNPVIDICIIFFYCFPLNRALNDEMGAGFSPSLLLI